MRLTGIGGMVLYVGIVWGLGVAAMRMLEVKAAPGGGISFAIALLAVLPIAAYLAPRRLRAVQATWTVPGPCHAGAEATLGAALNAPGGAPPFTLEAFNPATRRWGTVLRLRGLGAAVLRPAWSVRFPRRGLVRLPPLVARGEQPFGALSAARAVSPPNEVLVLPALGTVRRALHARLRAWMDLHASSVTDAGDDELAYLRPYRPGDAPHGIHWRASARHGGLLVAERHALGCKRLAVVVDTAGGDPRKLERLICAAATLVDDLGSHGWSLTLYGTFAPRGVTGDRDRLLEALALAPADQRPVADFVPMGMPALVLCHGAAPPLAGVRPRPLVLSLGELDDLVRIPRRLR